MMRYIYIYIEDYSRSGDIKNTDMMRKTLKRIETRTMERKG